MIFGPSPGTWLEVPADLLDRSHAADDPRYRGEDPHHLPDPHAEAPQPVLIGIRSLGHLGLQFDDGFHGVFLIGCRSLDPSQALPDSGELILQRQYQRVRRPGA